MVDWGLYEKLLTDNFGSDNLRRESICDAIDMFESSIVNHPAYQKYASINGEPSPLVVSRKSTSKCSIKAFRGTHINIGDIVECLNEKWIVVELYRDIVGIICGEMWLCNDRLQFQNFTPVIHQRYCVIDDGTYSKRSSDPDLFIPTNTYKIFLPLDDETRKLYVDKRLGLGLIHSRDNTQILDVYKIIGMDVKSANTGAGSHLVVLTVQKDVYHPDEDNIEQLICDFVYDELDANAVSAVNPSTLECAIVGQDKIRIGTSRNYEAVFRTLDGIGKNDVFAVWNVVASSGVKYEINGNKCVIEIPLDGALVGETVTLSVSDKSGVHGHCEKKVQVISLG